MARRMREDGIESSSCAVRLLGPGATALCKAKQLFSRSLGFHFVEDLRTREAGHGPWVIVSPGSQHSVGESAVVAYRDGLTRSTGLDYFVQASPHGPDDRNAQREALQRCVRQIVAARGYDRSNRLRQNTVEQGLG